MIQLHLENFELSDGRTVAADAECEGLIDNDDDMGEIKNILITDGDNDIAFDDLPENDREELYDVLMDEAWKQVEP